MLWTASSLNSGVNRGVPIRSSCAQTIGQDRLPGRVQSRTETQRVHFVFMPRMRKGEQKPYYSVSSIGHRWNAAVKRAGIRRRNPYHTRHTFACWLLSAGANPSFIASQMGHENAQMVYEVYAAWIEELNGDQVLMLNSKLAL
ncbi:tyrosine-type recombinase/integrase [Serratia sp. CY29653]|uniref:tyrosine-type recombinase/integrase n=1 Tax=Serratia sp. CY29653 TaxID=3383594 RepID=UPI003FA0A68A